MTKKFLAAALVLGLAGMSSPAMAIPVLQVDIGGGFFTGDTPTDGSEGNLDETIITTSDVFTAYAYLTPKTSDSAADIAARLADTYYFSIALVPKTDTAANLGSFQVTSNATVSGGTLDGTSTSGGTTVNVTGDMVFGTPPIEDVETQLSDPNDLSSHGIFETFFIELAFQFDPNNTASAVDVNVDAGSGPDTSGTGMFYQAFSFDLTQLAAGNDLHFDLYNTKVRYCSKPGNNCVAGDIDVDDFAPFSHDGGTKRVPEPDSLALMGLGVLLLGFLGRRRIAQAT